MSTSLNTNSGERSSSRSDATDTWKPRPDKIVDDLVDLGVIAHRGGDETDLVRELPDLPGTFHDGLAGEAAHREVVVARPAEAAHAGAAARDLDHELHRHLGVRGEDRGLGKIHGPRIRALPHDPAGAFHARDRAIGIPVDVVPRGHVEAVLLLEGVEAETRAAVTAPRFNDLRDEHFTLADRDHIREGREWLGIEEGGGAADQNERVAATAVLRTQRNPGHPQHLDDVEIVVLEGHRERDDIEVAQRCSGFKARQCPHRAAFLLFGQEGALADDLVEAVEVRVNPLEAEVRHADVVEVRVGENDPQRAMRLPGSQMDLGLEAGTSKTVVSGHGQRLGQAPTL